MENDWWPKPKAVVKFTEQKDGTLTAKTFWHQVKKTPVQNVKGQQTA